MLAQIKVYKNMIVGALIIGLFISLYVYVDGLISQISYLHGKLKDSQIEVANYKLENERYKTKVNEQNEAIELIKTDRQQALNNLAKWRELPPKVKYKTITKIREVKSDECEDIKDQLDAIRSIDYKLL